MRKGSTCFLCAGLIIGCMLLLSPEVFSQSNQTDSVTPTADGSAYVKGLTTGRAWSIVGGLVGLTSLIVGWRSKVRAGNKRTAAMVAVTLGLAGIILSVVHLSITSGAVFGSGSGKAGAIIALLLNLAGFTVGMLALRKKQNEV